MLWLKAYQRKIWRQSTRATHSLRTFFVITVVCILFAGFGLTHLNAQGENKASAPEPQVTQAHIKRLYNRSCVSCHASGAAGAPRTYDLSAWALRLEKGMQELVKNTREGYQGMPPKGLCFTCTDEEFEALIVYMAKSP